MTRPNPLLVLVAFACLVVLIATSLHRIATFDPCAEVKPPSGSDYAAGVWYLDGVVIGYSASEDPPVYSSPTCP